MAFWTSPPISILLMHFLLWSVLAFVFKAKIVYAWMASALISPEALIRGIKTINADFLVSSNLLAVHSAHTKHCGVLVPLETLSQICAIEWQIIDAGECHGNCQDANWKMTPTALSTTDFHLIEIYCFISRKSFSSKLCGLDKENQFSQKH